ncbi:VOC family protein [Spongiactinospora sp. TRM90649]|uniref:VOC family protein n=1 Tax=Spongiactinospora sp. TRM90649 TaxID=3031114 RepID=UPI0023F7FF4F|nr:VOC family protein [Spongiactinospora sp. TRM90649]MDF5752856.1 VOC family protein [Spongiactinospora sp. TRM90649]
MDFMFGKGFQVRSFFHATSVVYDMGLIADLHKRVFGVETTTIPYMSARFAHFTFIGDVPIEATSPNLAYATPKRMFLQLAGNHWSPAVFWIDDALDFTHLTGLRHGYRYTHLMDGKPVEGVPENRPEHAIHLYSNPFQTGVDWGMYEMDENSPNTKATYRNVDPFEEAGSYTPPPARDDVVSVVRHAQHSVVTDDPAKTLRFLVDALGGEVFAETENKTLNTRSTFLTLGKVRPFTVEVAEPYGPGGPAQDLEKNGSIYHRLDFKVHDLDAAVRHLERENIGLEAKGDDFVVLNPKDTHGLRYGLFADLQPGDPRNG